LYINYWAKGNESRIFAAVGEKVLEKKRSVWFPEIIGGIY